MIGSRRLTTGSLAILWKERMSPASDAKLNTETPGSVIDRLSIMSLRIYHMIEQLERDDAEPDHLAKFIRSWLCVANNTQTFQIPWRTLGGHRQRCETAQDVPANEDVQRSDFESLSLRQADSKSRVARDRSKIRSVNRAKLSSRTCRADVRNLESGLDNERVPSRL